MLEYEYEEDEEDEEENRTTTQAPLLEPCVCNRTATIEKESLHCSEQSVDADGCPINRCGGEAGCATRQGCGGSARGTCVPEFVPCEGLSSSAKKAFDETLAWLGAGTPGGATGREWSCGDGGFDNLGTAWNMMHELGRWNKRLLIICHEYVVKATVDWEARQNIRIAALLSEREFRGDIMDVFYDTCFNEVTGPSRAAPHRTPPPRTAHTAPCRTTLCTTPKRTALPAQHRNTTGTHGL